MDSTDNPPLIPNFIDLTSLDPPILPSQNTEVARPDQQFTSIGQSQHDTTNITMSSDKPSLFRPPAFTLDLFNEYVDEDDDNNTIDVEPEGKSTPFYSTSLSKANILKVTVLSSAQNLDCRTLLSGFATPEQSSQGTPSSDDTTQGGSFVKSENNHNANIDGDGYNYDNDDAVGVFARRTKRPRPFRANTNPFVTPTRVPTLTQQGRRLPKDLRMGYRRSQQNIIMGGDSYIDLDYAPNSSRRRVSTPSYGRVHTTMPSTNLIPTGGGGYLVTNSFMSSAQRKRLEQQEKLEKVLTDLEECLAACPADVKLRAKKLHLEELQRHLMRPDSTALKGEEAALIRDVERMLQRRRMNMVKTEFENQAKAMVENMTMSSSSLETNGRKRAYDGSMTPLSSNWSETAAPSETFSFLHPSTGGKTVPQSYYEKRKRGRITHDLADTEDADDEFQNDKDDDEDVVWDNEHERKTYGGKTIEQKSVGRISDDEMAKLLMDAVEEESGDKKDEAEAEDSGDDVSETSDDNTGDERDIGGKGKDASDTKENDDDLDEEDAAGGKDDESKEDEDEEEDETQKETKEDGGNGDANE
ncbi:hypothetical protein EIK77_000627 [Talaromyces pinophilus]|nr:hypothetical protein EIK77_000627 [Talaromyces pinophilus]PCG88878.1 Hypothetical protein PENO1_107740 [Penicillium occitanis (nom. inval.)]PCH10184.1 hypothetical protein PENOC_004480 [Penicillium occitanis (nom. inval.)]